MALYLTHRVNEGVNIKLNGFSIDITVIAIGNWTSRKEACLEVEGIEDIDKICLSPSEDLVSLGHDIFIGIYREDISYRISNEDLLRYITYDRDDNTVKICYDIPKEAIIKKKCNNN